MIAPSGVPTLEDYGRMLKAGWALILAAVVLSSVLAWGATFLVSPSYTAVSRVFVTAPGPNSPKASAEGNRSSLVRVESYAELARGEQILRRVIAAEQLAIEPAELKKAITVLPSPGSALIAISVVDADAVRARDVANSVAVQLVKLVGEIDLGVGGVVSEVRIIDEATVPGSATTPKVTSNVILGAVMGLLLSSVLVLARGIARDSIDHEKQIEDIVKRVAGEKVR